MENPNFKAEEKENVISKRLPGEVITKLHIFLIKINKPARFLKCNKILIHAASSAVIIPAGIIYFPFFTYVSSNMIWRLRQREKHRLRNQKR